ncbi:hypothetical protein TgHK011_006841 [Trichoderma gracile]|nr:hypothetical protein TgHK011_006841 [Trichoderma gracile]
MAKLKIFNQHAFDESNPPELDIILVIEAWSEAECDDDQAAKEFKSRSANKSRISQFFLRMDDTQGGVFMLESLRAEANALLHGILDLRKRDAEGFGGLILKQALALLPRTYEELNDLSRHIWATLFICPIHRWEDEATLKTALEQILTAQHGLDHTAALQHSSALVEIISATNIAFYDSNAMFKSRFISVVPTESAFPKAILYKDMGSLCHPLEETVQASCPYREMLDAVACHSLIYRRSHREYPVTQSLDVHLVAALRYAVPHYPDRHPTNNHLKGQSEEEWATWMRSEGTSFRLTRVHPPGQDDTTKSASCSIPKLSVGGGLGFRFDFSSRVANYTSMNAFLWTWLSQLLSQFKSRWISYQGFGGIAPNKFSQHFDVVGKMYDLGDDDLLRICVCTLKDNIQAQRQQPTLLILNNVDASCGWQMSVVKKLNETFRGSHLRLKVLITSQRIDTIEQSLGLVPGRISHQFAKEARSKPCKAQKLSMLQTRNKTALHIFRRHYPVVQRLRSTTTNIASLLQLSNPQGLQEFEVGTNSRLVQYTPKHYPTKILFDQTPSKSSSLERPLEDLALTIILRSMRPLKKAEFESLLNMAIDSSSTTSDKVFKEVEELYGGRFIITQGRVLLAKDMFRESRQSQENLADTQWYQEETESHSYLADWCLRYLQLPENQDILRCLRQRDGMPWFDADHSLLWYAVDHWAEHARRSEGFWSPDRPDFQSLLADDMAVLNLWAVAKAMRQPAIPCVTARPQTALFILARHGLPQAVDVVANLARGNDTFDDELPDAFIAAVSSGNLETIRVLAQQVELRRFDVDQAVLAAIESKVKEVLVEVIDHSCRLGLEIGDIAAYLARAASLDNVVALQVLQEKILQHKPLDELSKASFPLSLACYTEKPDILVAMLKHGLSPPQGDIKGWRQPMETVCRYGGSALVKPLLEHFESKHPRDTELLTSICRELLKEADEYGQCAVISSILDWASANSLILLNQHMLCLSDAFWSNMENARLLMSPFKQPRIFEDGHALFKEAVFVLFAKAVFGIVQELLQPPITMGEDTFCSLLRTAILKFNEKLIRLICTVGSRSHIDMTYPAVRDTILTEGFIQISIGSNFIAPLLELNLDPNLEVPSLGRSMLGYAAYHNRIDAVRALLAAGAKVDEGGDDWTPLHCAYDNTEITVLLLENGADVNLRDVSNRSALYFASKWGHSGVVSAILGKKPHSDTLEQALGVALQNSQAHIAELLVRHDDDLTTESSDAGAWLAIAVSTSNAALVNLILDRCRGLDINQLSSDEWSEAPLHCISNSTEAIIVRTLAARGADVNILNWRKETPLWKAAAADNLSVAQCLVRRGAKVNGPDNQPVALVEACGSASPDFVKFMLDEGADINAACYANPGTALHAALLRDEDEGEGEARKAQILDVLLNTDGINVRIRSRLWGSVLNAAAMKCQPNIVKRLLKMGVAANDVDHLGREPIHFALLQSVETAQLLLREEGVTLDGEDTLGRHALHFAVQSQRLEIVEFILRERPLLVNKPDIHGWTPLLWALRAPPTFRGSATLGQLKQVLTLLLNSGAGKFVKGDGADGEVWTPARLASYRDLSADVLELVTPNEGELGQCQDLDRDIWAEACGRQGRFQSTAGDGLGFECSDADCTIAMFYMCWKCGLSKELLHSGSTHVLYAIRDETESDERSATSDEDEEEESDEEEGDETEEEEQEGETEEEHGQNINED